MSVSPRFSGIIAGTTVVTVERLDVPAGMRLRGHGHEQPHLCYLLRGAFDERHGRRRRDVTPGTLRRSPAGDSHDIRFLAPSRCLLVLVQGNPGEIASRLPSHREFLASARIQALARELSIALDSPEDASALQLDAQVFELLAASMPTLGRRAPVPPRWLERIRERIRDAPADAPATADLAGEAGYHPVYVARAFREYFGMGIGAYARLVQAEHARTLLAQSSEPLAWIAARAGYADQSHLTRAMRRLLGATPGLLRQHSGRALKVSSVQDGPVVGR